jgi:hypothetical protein
METVKKFDSVEVPIRFKCDVHKWMGAYTGVFNHPFFAVTNDQGAFEIKNLPPGNYVIEAWHEKYGPQTQNVTITGPSRCGDFPREPACRLQSVLPAGPPAHFFLGCAPSAGGGFLPAAPAGRFRYSGRIDTPSTDFGSPNPWSSRSALFFRRHRRREGRAQLHSRQ